MPIPWTRREAAAPPSRLEPPPAPARRDADPPSDRAATGSATGSPATFAVEVPRRSLAELVVADEVRARLEAMLARIRHHETLFVEWDLRSIEPRMTGAAVNLYGPPGTGKTLCAEAIAAHLGRPWIRVSYAELESKYVGETSKNIVAAFAAARESGAVLFFDEADSILGRRLTSVTQSADHAVNTARAVMLTQLGDFDGVVIFATNLATNYDAAFVRRIYAHVELPLPDEPTLARLWAHLLPARLPRGADVDPGALAARSLGLAGGDLVNVVVGAASAAVQREGARRCVQLADLDAAIDDAKRAKRDVGSSPLVRPPTATTEILPLVEAPFEVQRAAAEA